MNNEISNQKVEGVIFTLRTIAEDFKEKGWAARSERMYESIRLIERLHRGVATRDRIIDRVGNLLLRRESLPPIEEVETGLESRAYGLLKDYVERAADRVTAGESK